MYVQMRGELEKKKKERRQRTNQIARNIQKRIYLIKKPQKQKHRTNKSINYILNVC